MCLPCVAGSQNHFKSDGCGHMMGVRICEVVDFWKKGNCFRQICEWVPFVAVSSGPPHFVDSCCVEKCPLVH